MFKILTKNQSIVSEFFLNKTYLNNNSVYYEYSNDSSDQTLTLNSYTQIGFVDDKTYVVIDSGNIYIKNSHFLDFAIKLDLTFSDNITSVDTNIEVILYEDYYSENNYPSQKLMQFLPKWSTPYKMARSRTQKLYSVYWSIVNNTYEISKKFIIKKRQGAELYYIYTKDYFNSVLDVSKYGCIKNAYAFYYNSVIPLLLKLKERREVNFLLKYENITSYCYYNDGYKTDLTAYTFYNFISPAFTEIESLLDKGSNFWILYEDKQDTEINSDKTAEVYVCALDENLKKKEYLINVSNLNPYLIKENLLWITDIKSSKPISILNYLENRVCKNSNKNSIGYRDSYIPFSENEEIMYPEININGNILTINDLYQKSACLKYKFPVVVEQFVIPNKHWIFIRNGINLYYGLLSQNNSSYPSQNIINSSFNNNLFVRNKQIDLGISTTAEFMIDFYSILEYTSASTYSVKINTDKESYYLIESIAIPKETSKYIKIEDIDLDTNYFIVTLELDKPSGNLYQAGEALEIIPLKRIDTNVSNVYLYNGNHIAIQKTTGKIYEYEPIDYLYYQHNQTCYSEYPHELY